MVRQNFREVVHTISLMSILREFDPVLIGTPPLDIAIEESDIDIACSSMDLDHFEAVATREFGQFDDFQCLHRTFQETSSTIIQFFALGWEIEIFCQPIPTHLQWGVRHFEIEKRLLKLQPKLRAAVIRLKENGLKTEPAFAAVLGLEGDPYSSILELETMCDEELISLTDAMNDLP